jgi:hypothetical protein
MTQVVQEQNSLLHQQDIVNDFRCFLTTKSDLWVRFTMDISPWTRSHLPPAAVYFVLGGTVNIAFASRLHGEA